MKQKFLYLGIPCIFISIGFYYLNHTNTGNYKQNTIVSQLDQLQLGEKKFDIPIVNNQDLHNNVNGFYNKYDAVKEPLDNSGVVALFSPRSDIRHTLISYIEAETEGIICAAFRLTDQQITKAFLSAHERRVPLTFIIDKEGLSSMHSKVLNLFNLGVPVYIFPPVGNIDDTAIQGLMHNKIMLLLGQKIVITGSFNFTKSAQDRNRENIVIIKNNEKVFNDYLQEMHTIMGESSKFQSQYIENKTRNKKRKKKIKKKK
jgi:phosphatidylserine/phosphatidylglycerophosphate/cardiolipin synthase-like enzyme